MAWVVTKQNNEFNLAESTLQSMADTTTITSDVINQAITGRWVILGINVTVGGTDVVADCTLEASIDGNTWVAISTLVADTTPNVTGYKVAIVDLTEKPYPWWRMKFNAAGVDVDAVGRFTFVVCCAGTYYERAI